MSIIFIQPIIIIPIIPIKTVVVNHIGRLSSILVETNVLVRVSSILTLFTGVPQSGQHLPGITHTVSPFSKQAGHLFPGTGTSFIPEFPSLGVGVVGVGSVNSIKLDWNINLGVIVNIFY